MRASLSTAGQEQSLRLHHSKQTSCHANMTGHRDLQGMCSCGDSSNESALQQQLHCTEASYLCSMAPKAVGNGFTSAFVQVTIADSRTLPGPIWCWGHDSSSLRGEMKLARCDRRHRFLMRRTGSNRQTQVCRSCQEDTHQAPVCPNQFIMMLLTSNATVKDPTSTRDMDSTFPSQFKLLLPLFKPSECWSSLNEAPVWRSLNKQVSGVLNGILGGTETSQWR